LWEMQIIIIDDGARDSRGIAILMRSVASTIAMENIVGRAIVERTKWSVFSYASFRYV